MSQISKGTKAVVAFGDNIVEIRDGSITLQDVCEAFGVACGAGVFVREVESGRAVATLPFESVFSPPAVVVKTEARNEEEEEDDEDDEPFALELVCPTAVGDTAASAVHGSTAAPADATATEDAAAAAAAATMDVAMMELVKLGALELLSPDSTQQVAQLPPYEAAAAPGLLRRAIYPNSVYSPFRARRDPLASAPRPSQQPCDNTYHQQQQAAAAAAAAAAASRMGTYLKDGAPYASARDVYGLELLCAEDFAGIYGGDAGAEEADGHAVADLLCRRPDLAPLTEEEVAKLLA